MSTKINYKLVDEQNRKLLGEARQEGTGFAFLKRDGDTFTTVGPISTCKDYLNEQIYSEWTGKPYSRYGYKATKQGIFSGDFGYLAMSVLKTQYSYGSSKENPSIAKYMDNMEKNHIHILNFINKFEEMLKLPTKTELHKVDTNKDIIFSPIFWCEFPYRMSLYAMLIRFAVESGYDGKVEPLAAAIACKTSDGIMMADALGKFHKMVDGKFPTIDYKEERSWHDYGICSVSF